MTENSLLGGLKLKVAKISGQMCLIFIKFKMKLKIYISKILTYCIIKIIIKLKNNIGL